MTVVWTAQAAERLEEIEDYIRQRSSPERAERFVNELIRSTDRVLSRQPRSGRRVPELPDSRLRERIHRGYRIDYRLRAKRVEILTVFEGHRLLRADELD